MNIQPMRIVPKYTHRGLIHRYAYRKVKRARIARISSVVNFWLVPQPIGSSATLARDDT